MNNIPKVIIREKIKELYRHGYRTDEISRTLGLPESVVVNVLEKAGIL